METLHSRQSADRKGGFRHADASSKVYADDQKNMTIYWWEVAIQVLKRIEDKPQYIREEDWPLIEQLFESYIFRKFISGEQTSNPNMWIYDDDIIIRDSRNEFVSVVGELYEKICASNASSELGIANQTS
jgi:hypothetical protein